MSHPPLSQASMRGLERKVWPCCGWREPKSRTGLSFPIQTLIVCALTQNSRLSKRGSNLISPARTFRLPKGGEYLRLFLNFAVPPTDKEFGSSLGFDASILRALGSPL